MEYVYLLIIAVLVTLLIYKNVRRKAAERPKLNNELLQQVIQSQEEERKRIGHDLHDDIGTQLSAVKLHLNNIITKVNNEQMLKDIYSLNQEIDGTVQKVRDISHQLLPTTLEKMGLTSALNELCNRIKKTGEISINCRETGNSRRFDRMKELGFFRIAQELINNAIKHSDASSLSLELIRKEELVSFSIEDDGKGFDYQALKQREALDIGGLGISNIEARSNAIGAFVMYDTMPGKGTKVEVGLAL